MPSPRARLLVPLFEGCQSVEAVRHVLVSQCVSAANKSCLPRPRWVVSLLGEAGEFGKSFPAFSKASSDDSSQRYGGPLPAILHGTYHCQAPLTVNQVLKSAHRVDGVIPGRPNSVHRRGTASVTVRQGRRRK